MPWREVCSMDEKMRFMAAVLSEEESMTELCERFGISRKTGYQLLHRYREEHAAGLAERSRAPHVTRWAISKAQAEAIIGVRRAHPSWGPGSCARTCSGARPRKVGRRRALLASCCAGKD